MSVLLLLAALASAPVADSAATVTPAATAAQTTVRLTLNNNRRFWPGERARVQVEAADDGYLWVLQVDTDGFVRVLFPLDPDDDNYVQGGRRYEVRGRGGRESFTAERSGGQGFVYAAWQRQPFRFDAVQLNGHWDYRALAPRALAPNPEPELNELLGRLSEARWEYDLLSYVVRGDDDGGALVDVASGPVVVNRFYNAPVNYAGRFWWRDSWCSTYWYGSVACDPYRARFGGGFIGVGFGGGWGPGFDPFFDHGWFPGGGWGPDPWGWNGFGFGGGWYGNGWNHGGWGGGWNNGWNNGWNGGWNGGWHGGGWSGGGHGGGYIPPRGTNYDLKGRNRTWSGAPGPAPAPVTFAAGRNPRNRTGTTVAGPMPVGPVRDVDPTEGLGGRRWSLPPGFPVDRDGRSGRNRLGGGTTTASTGAPRPEPVPGATSGDRGRTRGWNGAAPADAGGRTPTGEPVSSEPRAPRNRPSNGERDGEWTPAPRTPDRRWPVPARNDERAPRPAPETEAYVPRPMPRDDQPRREPTPRDEPWAPRPVPREEPRAPAPRDEAPREPVRDRTWEPRAEPRQDAPAPQREAPRYDPPRREPPRQEPRRQEPRREPPPRQEAPRVEPRREEPRSAPAPRMREWTRGTN